MSACLLSSESPPHSDSQYCAACQEMHGLNFTFTAVAWFLKPRKDIVSLKWHRTIARLSSIL